MPPPGVLCCISVLSTPQNRVSLCHSGSCVNPSLSPDSSKVAAGGVSLLPLSLLKSSGQNSLFPNAREISQQLQATSTSPAAECGVRPSCTQYLSAAEKQTHPCPALCPAAADPCSLTSCSEFVLHDHKPGKKMSLPPVFPESHRNFFLLLLSTCKLSPSYQTQPF